MVSWTHPICDACWTLRNKGYEPGRLKPEHREELECCFCGKNTKSGIYIREDPKLIDCRCGGR